MQATSDLSMKRQVYFPTLIYRFQLPDAAPLNAMLMAELTKERVADIDGVEKSNYAKLGGWHSRTDLHRSPEFDILTTQIHAAADMVSADLGYRDDHALRPSSMWSIINPPGTSNRAHVHPGCLWSGVYYIQAPEDSGQIAFYDPRTVNVMQRPRYEVGQPRPRRVWTKARFTPTTGRMFIFPSWLYHSVEPNLSSGERVIVSFNLSQRKVPATA